MAQPSLALIPSTIDNVVYSAIPADGTGDFSFTRATSATRTNKDGLIETVLSGNNRLDYSQGCPVLLLEPSSTNLLNYSEQLSSFPSQTTITIVDNETISPDGGKNASKLTQTANAARISQQNFSANAGDVITFSCWIKNIDATDIRFLYFDINNVIAVGSDNLVPQLSTTEWTRVTWSYTVTQTTTNFQAQFCRFTGFTQTSIYAGVFILQTNDFVTTYIPTAGGQVTRNGELFTDKVVDYGSNFTIYAEANQITGTNANNFIMRFGTTSPLLYLSCMNNGNLVFYTSDGTGYFTDSGKKIAISYDGNIWTWAYDGVSQTRDAGLNDVVFNIIRWSTTGTAGGGFPKMGLKKFLIYDSVLSASELEQLTS